MKLPERLLLAACSGRMLAVSAARVGIRPVVLDLYADQDTRDHAAACERIAPGQIGFDAEALLDAAERLAPAQDGFAVVYGSGVDIAPELLERLAAGRQVYGNMPATLRLLKTPTAFFELLDRLAIPYPDTRFTPPESPAGWLVKPGCGEGGKGVGFCAQVRRATAGDYYQRWLPGSPLSALFIADGREARIIGFNTLWTASHFGQPFLFVGAVNRAELTRVQRAEVADYVARLTRAVGLKGLNSLDFMRDGAVCRVLEINPRPSATLALYDPDIPEGLCARHIRACRGELGGVWPERYRVRGFRVWFAPRDIVLPMAWDWPEWCADRPVPNSLVTAGEPFCTIEAAGDDSAAVERLLQQREYTLIESFFP